MATRCLTLLALASGLVQAKYSTVQLTRHIGDTDHEGYGVTKRSLNSLPATFALHDFWYAAWDVGNSKKLNLAIDTGSPIVELNPGLYKPGSDAINLHQQAQEDYEGTKPDGCGYLNITFNKYKDTVSAPGITAKNQHLGDCIEQNLHTPGTETQLPAPFQGIMGLSGNSSAYTGSLGGLPWFANACQQNQVDECRFGVAFGTLGKGSLSFGGVNNELFEGSLHRSAVDQFQWSIKGGVTNNNKEVFSNKTFILDTGTPNVIGPTEEVKKLFEMNNIQMVSRNLSGCVPSLFGYYPCDKPPTIGFTMGGKPFNILSEPSALKHHGNNNCSSTLVGQPASYWLIGQAWMQGKYFDFDLEGAGSIAAANLKDPVSAT